MPIRLIRSIRLVSRLDFQYMNYYLPQNESRFAKDSVEKCQDSVKIRWRNCDES